MSNLILVQIHQILGNIVQNFNIQQTGVDKYYPWTDILAAAEFVILSKTSKKKGYSPGVLIFGRDMILPIKHRLDWKLIHQIKYTKINSDNNCENKHRVDYDYKSGDKVMLT